MRGLKHQYNQLYKYGEEVASFTDAWIETVELMDVKREDDGRIFYRCVDWNIVYINLSTWFFVASFTDAWIETDNAIKMSGLEVVASFTDAWIETRHWDIRTLRI